MQHGCNMAAHSHGSGRRRQRVGLRRRSDEPVVPRVELLTFGRAELLPQDGRPVELPARRAGEQAQPEDVLFKRCVRVGPMAVCPRRHRHRVRFPGASLALLAAMDPFLRPATGQFEGRMGFGKFWQICHCVPKRKSPLTYGDQDAIMHAKSN
jgi:hypothetical protein